MILDFKLKESNDVEQTIKDYVHYYNNERPAYSLKYKTPIQFKSELRLSKSFLYTVYFCLTSAKSGGFSFSARSLGS